MLNRMESTLLRGMVADLKAWQKWYRNYMADPSRPLPRYVLADLLRAEDAAKHRVLRKMDLAGWLGRSPSKSDSVLACRAYENLEVMGFIERLFGGGGQRTSAILVTVAGERMARGKAKGRKAG